ncbi:hypothetical protein Glove_123g97 [Diversispora epigaea]|uniref:Uncharacterized protein n=1 Tax=Diversispora epigaea TaxID=1348612 RepID=A0A397I1E2_9GLOM|nr:hypothetical protein Glove_291g16 [Diversispora epigaea]RHZ81200.1 hypothetical protein Glove_123g97 [Diversispora epigaea]
MPLTKVLRAARKRKTNRNANGKFISNKHNKHNNNESDFNAYSKESENEYDSDEYLEKQRKYLSGFDLVWTDFAQKKKRPYTGNSTATYYCKYGPRGKFTVAAKFTNSLTNFFNPNNSDDNKNEINNEAVSFIRIDSEYNENEINKCNETSVNNKLNRHNEINSEMGVH